MNHINPEKPMAIPELRFRIALSQVPGIGPVRARALVKEYGSATAIFSDKATWKGLNIPTCRVLSEADAELDYAARKGLRIISFDDPDYPTLLGGCTDAPFILYVKGRAKLQTPRSLSVVGTRRATSYGKDMCRKIIGELSEAVPGLTIVSGLAYGIDIMAHRAALEFGLPTVAVLGHGLDSIYPSRHRDSAKRIAETGALISDFVSSTKPERNNFLRRNRIIAGYSQATLVVESAIKGGALITADQALSYNRDVLAVPGRSTDLYSAGCNRLIRNNRAALTESGTDVLHHLNWNDVASGDFREEKLRVLHPRELAILHCLTLSPGLHPDELSSFTRIPVNLLLPLLLELELKDWIHMDAGMRYALNPCYLTLLKDIGKK